MSRPFPGLMSKALCIFRASPTYRQRFSYNTRHNRREENEFFHKCLNAKTLEDMGSEDIEFLSICVIEIEYVINVLMSEGSEKYISDMREAIPIDRETERRLRQLGKCI